MGCAHIELFALRILERRKELGLTIRDVNHHGGPTAPTVAKAEAGALQDPRPSTFAKFDAGLGWSPGTAAKIYWNGVDPQAGEGESRGQPAALEPAAGLVCVPLQGVLDLVGSLSALNRLLERRLRDEVIDVKELQEAAAWLNDRVGGIVAQFVTALLERNYSQRQRMQPLIECAFSELLTAPVSDEDPDREERLYRRWLLGKGYGVTAELSASFRRRLRSSSRQETTRA